MPLDNAKNFAKVTVSTGYDDAATSIVLASGHGAKLPSVSFNAVWWNSTDFADPSDDPNVEIVRVTAISTDTLTVARAQEGTSASTKNTGGKTYKMIAGVTAKWFNTDIFGIAAGSDGQIQYRASGVFAANSNFHFDASNARLGIGVAGSPACRLHVSSSASSTDTVRFQGPSSGGFVSYAILNIYNASSQRIVAIDGSNSTPDYGIFNVIGYPTASGEICGDFVFLNAGTGSSGDLRVGVLRMERGSSWNISNFKMQLRNGASFTDNVLFFTGAGLGAMNASSPNGMWDVRCRTSSTIGVIAQGASSQSANLLETRDSGSTVLSKIDSVGNLGVRMGGTSLTAYCHIAAGTSSASTAPLKLTSGTNMSTAEAGAVEYNGNFYLTKQNAIRYGVAGMLFSNTTQAGNTAATETDLFNTTINGGTLAVNGDTIYFWAAGTFGANANGDKRIRVKFGATTIYDSGTSASNNGKWCLIGVIVRTGATAQKAFVKCTDDALNVTVFAGYAAPAETLSGNVTLKLTGQGTSANDVVGEMWGGQLMPI